MVVPDMEDVRQKMTGRSGCYTVSDPELGQVSSFLLLVHRKSILQLPEYLIS